MSCNTKYEFTGETKTVFGVTLKRISALAAIGDVAAGAVGGWIEAESNLAVSGSAWVSGDARVYGSAWVYGDARVYGNARVYGDAQVSGDARVYGNARVYGDAQVYGDARATKTPITVSGITYAVTITDKHMQCGCEMHLLAEWREFDDRRIAAMDGVRAARFWKLHGPILLGIAENEGRIKEKK